MASEDMGLVQAQQRLDNGLNHRHHHHSHPQLVFPENAFSCGPPPPQRRAVAAPAAGDHSSKTSTRELTGGFIDHHHQQQHHHHYFHQPSPTDFRRAMFSSAPAAPSDRPNLDNSNNWNLSSRASATASGGDGSEEDDDVEDDDNDDDDDDDENEAEGLVDNSEKINNKNSNNGEKMGSQKLKCLPSYGKRA